VEFGRIGDARRPDGVLEAGEESRESVVERREPGVVRQDPRTLDLGPEGVEVRILPWCNRAGVDDVVQRRLAG
jgi:hypothetical protein